MPAITPSIPWFAQGNPYAGKLLWSFDLETHKVQDGLLAPPIVCLSDVRSNDKIGSAVWHWRFDRAREHARYMLENTKWVLVGANIAYDFACLAADDPTLLPLIFQAYREDRVFDVLIAETLHTIAEGRMRDELGNKQIIHPRTREPIRTPEGKQAKRFSLEIVTEIRLQRQAKANDRFRLSYAFLENLPLEQWPADARQYPIDDCVNALECAEDQIAHAHNLHDLPNQCRAAWALHLGSVWGIRANPKYVAELEAWSSWLQEGAIEFFQSSGLVLPDGSENLCEVKRRIIRAYNPGVPDAPCTMCGGTGESISEKTGGTIQCKTCSATGLVVHPGTPRTAQGINTSRETKAESGDEMLEQLAKVGPNNKTQSTYLPFVKTAALVPANLRPNVVVSTGRTSYDGVIQLLPRDTGVRECFEARPGYVYSSVDYAAIEMSTLAQVCLWSVGWSRLAESINSGRDAHCDLAELLFSKPYAEINAGKKKSPYKDWRQSCKAANFGFPGMMGPLKFVHTKRREGMRICLSMLRAKVCGAVKVRKWGNQECTPTCLECLRAATELRKAWLAKWAEIPHYFKKIEALLARTNGTIRQFCSGRYRGGCSAPSAANSFFQGLAADGAKLALWRMSKEMYLDRSSPLFGSRLVTFAHDETFLEVPVEIAHEAAKRQGDIMVEEMKRVCPDVAVSTEPTLCFRWYKAAEPVWSGEGENKRLVPWEPKLKFDKEKKLWL